jgi:hypothetical protein
MWGQVAVAMYQEQGRVLVGSSGAAAPPPPTTKRGAPMNNISPKVNAAALAAAAATIIWTVIAALSPGTFSETAIASLTGATGTILAFVFGFVIRDTKRAMA